MFLYRWVKNTIWVKKGLILYFGQCDSQPLGLFCPKWITMLLLLFWLLLCYALLLSQCVDTMRPLLGDGSKWLRSREARRDNYRLWLAI